MFKYNQRFFKFEECRYGKSQKKALLCFVAFDNFEPEIPRHEKEVTEQLIDLLDGDKIEIEFEYIMSAIDQSKRVTKKIDMTALESLASFSDNLTANVNVVERTDKTLPVKDVEYFLGTPIKMRPLKIKHLRISKDFQVTAGTINFLKKREYQRDAGPDKPDEKITKEYWTFMLGDGETQLQCVFFPSEKTRAKFEKLTDRSVVAIVGVHDKRGDRVSFRVMGVSLCELGA